jgi:hypothetical protein
MRRALFGADEPVAQDNTTQYLPVSAFRLRATGVSLQHAWYGQSTK